VATIEKKCTLPSVAGNSRPGLLYIASRTDSRIFFLQFPGARLLVCPRPSSVSTQKQPPTRRVYEASFSPSFFSSFFFSSLFLLFFSPGRFISIVSARKKYSPLAALAVVNAIVPFATRRFGDARARAHLRRSGSSLFSLSLSLFLSHRITRRAVAPFFLPRTSGASGERVKITKKRSGRVSFRTARSTAASCPRYEELASGGA